jgi:hypothetical protein
MVMGVELEPTESIHQQEKEQKVWNRDWSLTVYLYLDEWIVIHSIHKPRKWLFSTQQYDIIYIYSTAWYK